MKELELKASQNGGGGEPVSRTDERKDNTYPPTSGGYDLRLPPTLFNNLLLEKSQALLRQLIIR